MHKRAYCDMRLTLELDVCGPVLIKAGDGQLSAPDMAVVRTKRGGASGEPYFPGTSLKGVFRSYVERVARTLRPDDTVVCLPYMMDRENDQEHGTRRNGKKPCAQGSAAEQSCGKRLEGTTPKSTAYRLQCPACRMFGSLQFRGRTHVGDAYAHGGTPVVELRDGVGIDRKTGGSASGVLYNLEVVTRGTFVTTIELTNFESWQLGALSLVLGELEDERMRIGMGTSRGLGHVRGRVRDAQIRYVGNVNTVNRACGIERLVTEEVRRDYGFFRGTPEADHGAVPELGVSDNSSVLYQRYQLDDAALHSVMKFGREEFMKYADTWPDLGSQMVKS